MVGVPGRSRACLTCKQRSKGCDLRRPACTQCQRSGLTCGGYEKSWIFVVSTQNDRPTGNTYQLSTNFEQSNNGVAQSTALTRSAYQSRYMGFFWEAYLPYGRSVPANVASSHSCGWTEIVQRLCLKDDLVKLALLANSLRAIGSRDGKPWMVAESLKLYGMATQGLSKLLHGSVESRYDSAMMTAKLLGLFELFLEPDTDSKSWERHCSGELALLLKRGPESYARGDARDILLDERLHMLLPEVKKRKRSALSTAEWKTIPWLGAPKNLKDQLLDILLDFPGLLEELDIMRSCMNEHERNGLREKIIAKCWAYDRRLQDWLALLPPTSDLCVRICRTPPSDCTSIEEISLTCGLHTFWVACLLLYSTLSMVLGSQEALPGHTDPQIYVHNILSTAPILLNQKAGMYGQHVTVLPIALAMNLMEPGFEQQEEVIKVMEGPSGKLVKSYLLKLRFW